MGIIEVNHLTKYYGRRRGVEDVSFSVREGEIFGFLGPNGAGKTTTIRLLLDFIRPDKGTVQIFGFDARGDAVAIHRQIGYVSGEPFLYPYMRGRDLLNWLKSFRRYQPSWPFKRLFEIFQFDPHQFVKTYSSGNRKKLALIQALVHKPRLLILDEPTKGLDPIIKQQFYQVIRSLQRQGVTIFFSSHDLAEVQKICDRVAIIKNGRIAMVENVHDLISRSGVFIDVEFINPPLEPPAELKVIERVGKMWRFHVTGELQKALQAISYYSIKDINVYRPTLEDIFITWYQK